jgi:hypothetical protein
MVIVGYVDDAWCCLGAALLGFVYQRADISLTLEIDKTLSQWCQEVHCWSVLAWAKTQRSRDRNGIFLEQVASYTLPQFRWQWPR